MRHCCSSRRDPTETQLQLDDDQEIITSLEELEKEEKLFASHDLLDKIDGSTMEQFIDKRLDELLGCKLRDLMDSTLAERICKAFFKKREVIRDWKHKSNLPLFEGLLLAFIFNKMRKQFLEIHEPQTAEIYENLRDKMDAECTELLQICFREGEEQTRRALELNYHLFVHKGLCQDHRIRLMEIAYLGKANKFLAHPACQKAIDRRWQPSYRIGQTSFWLYIYYLLPILLLINRLAPYDKTPQEKKWKKVWNFYTSTSSKYVIHMTFRFIYVILYSFALLRLSGKSIQRERFPDDYWEELLVMGWQCSYIIEMVPVIVQGKFLTWAERNKTDFSRNLLIGLNIFTLILGCIVFQWRYFLLPIADLCFYLSYIIAVVRSMRVLYVDSFFGSIVYMINKMVPIMFKFSLIFVFFWGAFAICYISLSGHFHAENATYTSIPWQVFYHGAFEIFGEAVDDDKKGFVQSCQNVDMSTDSAFHCLFRTWMIPLLLFFYILISGIMLVNILTALLTKQYEDISKDYHIYWKVALYARLSEYEERFFVPAPLSVVYYVVQIMVLVASSLVKKLCHSCRKSAVVSSMAAVEMVPFVSVTPTVPPTPALARVGKKSEGALPMIEEQPTPRPSSSSSDDPLQALERPEILEIHKRLTHKKLIIRPHSAHGMTELNMDVPSFATQKSTTSSKAKSTAPPTPSEMVDDVIQMSMAGMKAISEEKTAEEKALKFIQDCRVNLIASQNERQGQKRVKQELIDKILQRVDLKFTERPRGMTE